MSDAAAPVAELLCGLCGLLYPATGHGRVHGQKFTCHACAAADKQLRRGLGNKSELQTLEPEEQKKLFQRLQKEKKAQGGTALPWVTVRAQLITTLTTKQVTSNTAKVRTENLPMGVWLARGWDKDIVEGCPCEKDEKLGWLYKVPVKSQTWKEAHHEIQERVLKQEKEMTQKRSKTKQKDGDDEDMDVPEPPKPQGQKTAKAEENEEKKAAQLAKKTAGLNGKVAMTAAKSVGILSSDLAALSKLKNRIEQPIPAGISETSMNSLDTLSAWTGACKQALTLAEKPEVQSGKEAQPLLAFDLNDVKMLHKTCIEVQKSLRPLLPPPKSKAKAKAASQPRAEGAKDAAEAVAEDHVTEEENKPKRRRTKSSA